MSPRDVDGIASEARYGLGVLARILKGDRSRRVLTVAVVGSILWEQGRTVYRWARQRAAYTVTLGSSDDVYDDVHAWLLSHLPPERRRALTARTKRRNSNGPVEVEGGHGRTPEGVVYLRYDGTRVHTVEMTGHRVRVELERDADRILLASDRDYDEGWGAPRERIVFTATTVEGRDAVIDWLAETTRAKYADVAHRFYMARRWGDWQRRNDLPPRPMRTVVLARGQLERLSADLAKFLEAEPSYARLGIPWHRGYLLYGPPGTGKTTVAKALAQEFGLDVYYVALSDLTADTNLLAMLGGVEPRSMLVLEDIDVVHAAKSRDDSESKNAISLSGLLNALDGFATPHGLVTVMTTNHLEVLDPALVRAGRVDLREELGPLDDDQLMRLARLIVGDAGLVGSLSLGTASLTHAEVVEAAKPFLDDPGEAALAILDLLNASVIAR